MMRCSVGGSRAANILCSLKIFNFSCYRRAGGEVMPEGRIEADYCLCSTHRYDDGVAPHAGAWIETATCADKRQRRRSRLMQARGLKPLWWTDLAHPG